MGEGSDRYMTPQFVDAVPTERDVDVLNRADAAIVTLLSAYLEAINLRRRGQQYNKDALRYSFGDFAYVRKAIALRKEELCPTPTPPKAMLAQQHPSQKVPVLSTVKVEETLVIRADDDLVSSRPRVRNLDTKRNPVSESIDEVEHDAIVRKTNRPLVRTL
jgi:hypothetical protein